MIRPLRRRHLGTFFVLAVVLPLLYVAALRVRTEPARSDSIPEGFLGERAAFQGEWNQPDPLLYWSEQPVEAGDALPADARLLGTVREGALVASIDAPPGGFLVVYSLAKQEVVERITGEGERQ